MRTILLPELRAALWSRSGQATRDRVLPILGADNTAALRAIRAASTSAAAPSIQYAGRTVSVRGLLPFSSDVALRKVYANPFNEFRLGPALEDLDAISATAALDHAGGDANCVTVAVDNVNVHRPITQWRLDRDMEYLSLLNWTGRSSMEISVVIVQDGECLLESDFVYVARDKAGTKSLTVPPYQPKTPEDAAAESAATQRQAVRKERAAASLAVTIPSDEEEHILHRMHKRGMDSRTEIPMEVTRHSSISYVQQDQRNLYGFMFGGVVLRKGFEKAHVATYLHAGTRPTLLQMCDTAFLKSVQIGSVFELEAQLAYCDSAHGIAVAAVEAFVKAPRVAVGGTVTGHAVRSQTSTMNFVFRVPPGTPSVFPVTYEQCMRFLAARRLALRAITGEPTHP
eukprot:m.108648 g.108648  ORF g.108648 m.108648 type:complete len:399 (-) comp9011_c1_seq5:128-1324(-)